MSATACSHHDVRSPALGRARPKIAIWPPWREAWPLAREDRDLTPLARHRPGPAVRVPRSGVRDPVGMVRNDSLLSRGTAFRISVRGSRFAASGPTVLTAAAACQYPQRRTVATCLPQRTANREVRTANRELRTTSLLKAGCRLSSSQADPGSRTSDPGLTPDPGLRTFHQRPDLRSYSTAALDGTVHVALPSMTRVLACEEDSSGGT